MIYAVVIKILADGALLPIVLISSYALVFKVPKGYRLQSYSRVLMAGLTSYLIAKLIGSVFQPSALRPFELMGTMAGASFLNNPGFPSDHTLLSAALVFAVWFETKNKHISLILAGLLTAVCIGRVLALVHTPVDVIGGILIAALGSLWYLNWRPKLLKSKLVLSKQQKSRII